MGAKYQVLLQHMLENNVSMRNIANLLGQPSRNVEEKILGTKAFSSDEILQIMNEFFPEHSASEIFNTET